MGTDGKINAFQFFDQTHRIDIEKRKQTEEQTDRKPIVWNEHNKESFEYELRFTLTKRGVDIRHKCKNS